MPGNTQLKIGYLLAEYPSPTETFIANEIRGLIGRGASVHVFALRRGEGTLPAPCPVYYRSGKALAGARRPRGGWVRLAAEALKLEAPCPLTLGAVLRNVPAASAFSRVVEREGIEHLHAHFAHVPADLALMIGALRGVSVSFSAHAWDVYCMERTLPAKLRRAALCLTCTEAARRHVEGLVAEPLHRRVRTIYHGTEPSRFGYSPRPQAGLPPRVLAVGRLVRKKGFDVLLRACHRLRSGLPVRCTIVGDGPLRAHLERLARSLGLEGSVTFKGMIPHREMPAEYGRADVVAVPSVVAPDGDRDGLPNVVLEAMASGVPVVGSRLSGIPEAIAHARTGLLCRPGSDEELAGALRRALSDEGFRRRCPPRARELVEKRFDCRRNSGQVYRALLRAAGRQAGRSLNRAGP